MDQQYVPALAPNAAVIAAKLKGPVGDLLRKVLVGRDDRLESNDAHTHYVDQPSYDHSCVKV